MGLKPPMLEKGLCPLVSPCPPGSSLWNSKLGDRHLTPRVHQTHFVKEKPRSRENGESEFVQGSEEELGAKSRLLALAELSGEQGVRQGPELRPTSFGGPGHHSCCSQSSTQAVPALTLAGYPEPFCFSWTEEAPLGASLCHLALWGDCHFWTINHRRGVSRARGPEVSTLQFGSVWPPRHTALFLHLSSHSFIAHTLLSSCSSQAPVQIWG